MWIECHVFTSDKHASDISEQLFAFGASAVTFQDAADHPIYEPNYHQVTLWPHTEVIGLFDENTFSPAIIHYCEEQSARGVIEKFFVKNLQDQEWIRTCLDYFKPMHFGERLWIYPSWHQPPDTHQVCVMLDPGLAFGTGTHATTALCLEWLANHISGNETVIDYGCGSGILAIAAVKLGATFAYAVDNDPQALIAAQQNAERNHISTKNFSVQPSKNFSAKADIIVANILAQPLMDLALHFISLLKPNGKIILSGILSEQANEIKKTYSQWFSHINLIKKDGWVLLECFQ